MSHSLKLTALTSSVFRFLVCFRFFYLCLLVCWLLHSNRLFSCSRLQLKDAREDRETRADDIKIRQNMMADEIHNGAVIWLETERTCEHQDKWLNEQKKMPEQVIRESRGDFRTDDGTEGRLQQVIYIIYCYISMTPEQIERNDRTPGHIPVGTLGLVTEKNDRTQWHMIKRKEGTPGQVKE